MKTDCGWLRRIILAALASLFVLLAAQPYLRRQVLRYAEQLSGTRLQPRRLISSLAQGQVILTDIRAVDPDQPERQLFAADELALQLDRAELWRGFVTVRRGHINGLQLSTPKMALENDDSRWPSEESRRSLSRWLRLLAQSLGNVDVETGQLAGLSRELSEARPRYVREVARRASDIVQQVQHLQDALDTVGENPLRNRIQYRQAVEEIDNLQGEMLRVRRELDQCQQQVRMDRDALNDAYQQDRSALSVVSVAGNVTPQQVTDYFLEAELQQRVRTALNWIRWGRQFFPSLYTSHPDTMQRGRDIRLLRAGTLGDVVIDSLVLRGECEGTVPPLRLEGTIAGWGNRPELRDQPVEITFQVSGTCQTIVRAQVGTRNGQPVDQIVVTGPRWTMPESLWGWSELLGMTVSEGECQYWLSLQHDQGQITGELVLKRADVLLSPRLDAATSMETAGAILAAAMRDIRRVEMTARLSGSWEHPTLDIRSNLGPELVARVDQQVAERQIARHDDLLAHIRRQTEVQLELVQSDLTQQHDELVQLLDAGAGKIDRLRATVAERVEQTDDMLQTDSPLRETLRR